MQCIRSGIDELHRHYPFAARLMLQGLLRGDWLERERQTATLMQKMGIEAIYRRPRPLNQHQVTKSSPTSLRSLSKLLMKRSPFPATLRYSTRTKGSEFTVMDFKWC